MQYQEAEHVAEYTLCEVTAWFARMWGIMETLDNLPQKDFKENVGILISWAEEFVEKEEKDMVLFFQQKVAAIK